MWQIATYPEPARCDAGTTGSDAAGGAAALSGTVFRLDRRTVSRHPAEGRVTAIRRDHDLDAYRRRTCTLTLCDLSDRGLAAISEVPLDLDERIAVLFSPHGGDSGIELTGHIVRCEPRHESADQPAPVKGYAVAIRFDPAAAA